MAFIAKRSLPYAASTAANDARLSTELGAADKCGEGKKVHEEDTTDGGSCSSDVESATSGSVATKSCSRQLSPSAEPRCAVEPSPASLRSSLRQRGAAVLATIATNGPPVAAWGQQGEFRAAARATLSSLAGNPRCRGRRGWRPPALQAELEPVKVRVPLFRCDPQRANLDPSLPAKKYPLYAAEFGNVTMQHMQMFDPRRPLKKAITTFLTAEAILCDAEDRCLSAR